VRLETVDVPAGFTMEIFARGVEGARSMALGDAGTVFVGTRGAGVVYALRDTDGDAHADEMVTVAADLDVPNGVAFRDGSLYVAEVSRVIRFDDVEQRWHDPLAPAVVNASFPSEAHHGWKYLRFGPDGKLYVPVGAPCNVCVRRDDERFATILRMNADGTDLEIFARGVRNSVGFDWHPETGEMWFTDNGRDWLGNDAPPDELNRAHASGLHFGFPHCHGGMLVDDELGAGRTCDQFEPPVQRLGPHVAALGMRFYTGDMFPEEYRGQIFIAEHGSWNRVPPIGYRVTVVRLDGNRALGYDVFADGWLRRGRAWGRPTDLLVLQDGSLLVSDDRAGVIYRISYRDS
jgi:glucose/arabinose dehydrogenase